MLLLSAEEAEVFELGVSLSQKPDSQEMFVQVTAEDGIGSKELLKTVGGAFFLLPLSQDLHCCHHLNPARRSLGEGI